jgi:hypothetical protein
MRFTPKDTVATAFVAAVVLIYVGYLAFDGIPLVRDVTGMAAVGLILGFASRRVGGRDAFPHARVAFAAGLGSMALGIATLITESEILLAIFVASIAALWVAATYLRTRVDRTRGTGPIGRVPLAH